MFEIGWSELLVIGVVALIVIGPRDLPAMFQQLGRFTAKMRAMARDFQRAMDQAANDSGLGDVAKDLRAAGSIKSTGINAMKDAAAKFEKWDPIKNAARPTAPAAPVGPETQALLDAQAKRQAIVAETTERLRALAKTPPPVVIDPAPEPVAAAAKPARKPRAKPDAVAEAPAEKPKKPRKSAKADTGKADTGKADKA